MDDEIEDCIRREYRRLVGAVAVSAGSVTVAEDAVQEAFARAWERSRQGQIFTHLAGWVATVALNLARTSSRRRRAEGRAVDRLHHDLLGSSGAGGLMATEIETRLVVQRAVQSLASRQRDVVVLRYLMDIDVATTAVLLGVSEGTVKSALSRARAHLAIALSTLDPEAS